MDTALTTLSTAIRENRWDLPKDLFSQVSKECKEWKTSSCCELTRALVDSTREQHRITPDQWSENATDLATTGGLTLKTSLIVSTWLARAGHPVPKIATTGSHRTGTIDLLQHLGLQTALSRQQLCDQVNRLGLAFCDSTHLAPADAPLMDFRRHNNCLKVAPLVIASILAKKMALGLKRFTVEVRAGQESKFGHYRDTIEGAHRLVEVARELGLEVLAVVTNGDLLGSHGTGAPLLARECLRHLHAYPTADSDESGLLWDRSHRQALELFCLAHWWSHRSSDIPDRAWLANSIREWNTKLENSHELFWKVAHAQGSQLQQAPTLPQFPQEKELKGPVWQITAASLKQFARNGARLHWKGNKTILSAQEPQDPPALESELPAATVLGMFTPEGPINLDENTLVASVGTSGGIVTEAIDRLVYDKKRVDRVITLHTIHASSLKEIDSLRRDLAPRMSDEFTLEICQKLKNAKREDSLPEPLIPADRPFGERLPLASFPLETEDLVDSDSNQQAFDLTMKILRAEQVHRKLWESRGQPWVGQQWVLAAGGRKTMSALVYFASMLFNCSETYHVLVNYERSGLYHVPPHEVNLVEMPRLHLGTLVDLVHEEKDSHQQIEDWSATLDRADRELTQLLEERDQRDKEAQEARDKLKDLLTNPLLPQKLKLVLVGTDEDLLHRLRQRLNSLADFDQVATLKDIAPDIDTDIVLIAHDQVTAEILPFALATTLPVLSLTPRSDPTTRSIDDFLRHRSHAYLWVDSSTLNGIEVALRCLLEGSEGERCSGSFKLSPETENANLLRILFAGRASSELAIKSEDAGVSQAKKLWITADNKPRRYFVKIAPYQSCFQEFLNYKDHVNGRADNYSGRIEWFPAREGSTSAIAYTEIGTGQADTLKKALKTDIVFIRDNWKDLVLERLSKFHGTPQPQDSQKISDDIIQSYLNPLLPAHDYVYDPNSSETLSGKLHEVEPDPGKLQLRLDSGQRVNIKNCSPHHLSSLRLHLGRPLKLTARRESTWQGKIAKEWHSLGLPALNLPEQIWQPLRDRDLSLGIIHGDMNLDNLMVEWSQKSDEKSHIRQIWLIDFAMTRKGPTAYDFAKLEIELWTQIGYELMRQDSTTDPYRLIEDVYQNRDQISDPELHAFAEIIHQTHSVGKSSPEIYCRLRAVYALNTLKFSNLNPHQKLISARLFEKFMKADS